MTQPRIVDVHLRQPHAKQLIFIRSTAKRKVIRAGRRGGKTTGIAIFAVEKFLQGRRVLYAAPTADQLGAFWKEVKKALEETIDAGIYYKNETEHIIEIAEGSEHTVIGSDVVPDRMRQRIRAKTAWNAETLRGDYADVLILDEFQLMNEDAWKTVGAPMLLDNNGDAVFIYTPPSLHSTATSKAEDLRYASKMFKQALAEMKAAEVEGRESRWLAVHFRSQDNPHISVEALSEITKDMTALAYRQEIEAEDIDEIPGALWTRDLIEKTRLQQSDCPPLHRIVVGVDPSGSSTTECGIGAAGLGYINKIEHLLIISDKSLAAPSPRTWATAAVALYHDLKADRIAGERNFGGDMVETTVRTVDENVSYKDVTATRGKLVRAEPIAALFEKGVAHIVGNLTQLEDELCSYVPGNPSPNRLDAMVWASTELVSGGSLGLVDLFKSGAAQAIVDQMSAKPAPAAPQAHPERTDLACTSCGCKTVTKIPGGQLRCQECGKQWGDSDVRAWHPARSAELSVRGGMVR